MDKLKVDVNNDLNIIKEINKEQKK